MADNIPANVPKIELEKVKIYPQIVIGKPITTHYPLEPTDEGLEYAFQVYSQFQKMLSQKR